MSLDASDIIGAVKNVTKEWAKQRKAEERGARSRHTRAYVYSDRVNFTEIAHAILPAAYEHASGGGKYTVSKRQLYYASREQFRQMTGREIEYGYFANTLLVQYMNQHAATDRWKATADPRGTLVIPNAVSEVRVPCGTTQMENHLRCERESHLWDDIDPRVDVEWPAASAGQRYGAVLYIEKEGFEPLLKEARIAERFDLAVLSCKGQSNVAARRFVDEVCRADGGVPLYVVHDFDKSGFEISQRLTQVSEWAECNDRVTYRFRNRIEVTDLGLRLEDARKYGLQDEPCVFKGGFARDSICTDEEKAFLRSGRRVELNTFTAPQFIEWIESALTAHGLGNRLVPDDAVLSEAWRRALLVARLNHAIDRELQDALVRTEEEDVPNGLRERVAAAVRGGPQPWDAVLYEMAQEALHRADQ